MNNTENEYIINKIITSFSKLKTCSTTKYERRTIKLKDNKDEREDKIIEKDKIDAIEADFQVMETNMEMTYHYL